MPTIDELSPPNLRGKKLDLTLDPLDEKPRARRPVTVLVSYARTLPESVALPLVFEVQGPSSSSYQRREFVRGKPPTTILWTPREGGRHNVTLREACHNYYWGSIAVEVAGDELQVEPQRSEP